jgi:hypothetical protein
VIANLAVLLPCGLAGGDARGQSLQIVYTNKRKVVFRMRATALLYVLVAGHLAQLEYAALSGTPS